MFADALRAIDERFGVTVKRVACARKSAGLDPSRTASRHTHTNASSSRAESADIPSTDSIPSSPDAPDPRDCSGCGA